MWDIIETWKRKNFFKSFPTANGRKQSEETS